jgi:ABC-2 type transport system permease protein
MSAPGKSTPIADLTYRSYDGPLEKPTYRWWPIAKLTMQQAMKRKGIYFWAVSSSIWYLILLAIFYFWDQISNGAQRVARTAQAGTPVVDPAKAFFGGINWKVQFLNAFSISQIWLFLIALLIGIGIIANDNRANALLVYLSKPCDKKDYLIGKWVGIFIPMTLICGVPTMVFYLYCLISYQQYGFVSQDPWLILRLLGMVLIPGVFHASACLGISSMFNQGRVAGATYAALYFVTLFFTKAMEGIHNSIALGGGAPNKTVENLYYASVDGIQIAMSKIVLGTDGGGLFPTQTQTMAGGKAVPAPNPMVFSLIFVSLCVFFIAIAWRRVRAVEVVG